MKNKIIANILILIAAASLCACGKKNQNGNGDYTVFYLNEDRDALVTYKLGNKTDDTNNDIAFLLDNLRKDVDKKHLSVFSHNIKVNNYSVAGGSVFIDFSGEYSQLDSLSRAFFKAAVVKTITQIEGIEKLSFTIDGHPLKNSNGTLIGMMRDTSFVDDDTSDVNMNSTFVTTVYYADEKGEKLVGEMVELSYGAGVTEMQAVVDRLIKGPDINGGYRALPEGINLLGVTMIDKVCYVNFDSVFLNSIADVTADVTLYSVVNSLCRLKNIDKVQIQVEGSSEGVFRDKFSLSDFYERNYDIISEGSE